MLSIQSVWAHLQAAPSGGGRGRRQGRRRGHATQPQPLAHSPTMFTPHQPTHPPWGCSVLGAAPLAGPPCCARYLRNARSMRSSINAAGSGPCTTAGSPDGRPRARGGQCGHASSVLQVHPAGPEAAFGTYRSPTGIAAPACPPMACWAITALQGWCRCVRTNRGGSRWRGMPRMPSQRRGHTGRGSLNEQARCNLLTRRAVTTGTATRRTPRPRAAAAATLHPARAGRRCGAHPAPRPL